MKVMKASAPGSFDCAPINLSAAQVGHVAIIEDFPQVGGPHRRTPTVARAFPGLWAAVTLSVSQWAPRLLRKGRASVRDGALAQTPDFPEHYCAPADVDAALAQYLAGAA